MSHWLTNEPESLRILVTGSQGTLGRKLMCELRKRGHNVYGCDIKHSEEGEIRADIAEARQVTRVFNQIRPNVVYHLAAEFGRQNGQEYYEQLWKTNVIGTRNIIDACVGTSTHLVFASSSEVYGTTAEDGTSLHEDVLKNTVPTFHNEYALSKWTNENQIAIASRNDGLVATILRFFNAYGPGEEYNNYRSVVCLFAYRLLHNMPITVYENYHRVFMYISDWQRTVANVIDHVSTLRDLPAEARVFNIGGTEYVAVEKMLDELITLIPETCSPIMLVPKERANVTNKRPDNSRAMKWLGHECRIGLREGLANTVAWMRTRYPQ